MIIQNYWKKRGRKMKITGIELLQKIKDDEISIYQKATSLDTTYINCTIEFILKASNINEIMNLEFEVQTEGKTEENKEIEELEFKESTYAEEKINKNTEKINELTKTVNKPIKESEEK